MLGYLEFLCLSRLECLITTNIPSKQSENELIGNKNLKYCVPVVFVLSHQLFGDTNHQDLFVQRSEPVSYPVEIKHH